MAAFLLVLNICHNTIRHEYMQVLLTKMVTSVRLGTMGPDDASRTIHECAALLELELANKLPVTTLILSGMQKTTTTVEVMSAFRKFGPVQDAAVASCQRGFGTCFCDSLVFHNLVVFASA